MAALMLCGGFLEGAKVGRVVSKPANAEKSLLAGNGTKAAHSVPRKLTFGGAPPGVPDLLS